ncbi:MAG: DUF882 domain-containing protein [Stellaceae bacterium]
MQASSLVTRRRLLGAAVAVTTVGLVKSAPALSYAPRSVSLYNTHTGEWLRTVYWADGHYIREAVRDINWILRDHHTDEMRPIDAGVLDVLGMMRERLDTSDPFLVVSGYRSPITNTRMYFHGEGVAKHSYHVKGMAIDLRSETRSLPQLRAAAMSLECGGVGYYPRANFVHVDCGPIRHW